MKNKLISIIAIFSLGVFAADNEIYLDQSGTTLNLDIEQLGISKDRMIDLALKNGSYGAKIIGSGGGGSILILTNKVNENKIINAMYKVGAKEVVKANVSPGIFSL